jgi:hypothetical protein
MATAMTTAAGMAATTATVIATATTAAEMASATTTVIAAATYTWPAG